jgi:membrane protease YdiL (CAAX protease family)
VAEPATSEVVAPTPTPTPPPPRPEADGPIAGPIHLVFVLAVMAFWAYRGAVDSDVIITAKINRPVFYIITILSEWLMLGIVLLGVRRHGSPYSTVLGARWHSLRELARDVGIAAAFWFGSSIILSLTMGQSKEAVPSGVVQALLPHGPLEIALWIALSVTAGICEEGIFRGYLQRQLIAYSRSPVIGIIATALAFGAGHLYKGGTGALRIVLFGAMFGILAYARRSVRPGMIAHAFTDAFAGVLARALGIRVG